MKKRKLLAPFLMLFSGTAAGIVMFRLNYDLKETLEWLLLILISFYIIGVLIAKMLDKFERQNEEAVIQEEGEVIEKEAEEDAESDIDAE